MEAQEEAFDQLTKGALLSIMTGDQSLKPINLQVLDVVGMGKYDCHIKISDGLFWHDAVTAHDIVLTRKDNYSIVEVDQYTVNISNKVIRGGEFEIRTLHCFGLSIVTPGRAVSSEVGNPEYLCHSVPYRDIVEPHRYINPSARPGFEIMKYELCADSRNRAQEYKLSEGVLCTMMTKHYTKAESPVLQVLRKSNLSIDRHIKRCNLLLSDGIYYHDAVLLSTQLEDENFNNSLENYAIIRISNYAVTPSFLRSEMALFEVEVVARADDVKQLVGYPEPLSIKWTREEYFQIPAPFLPLRTSTPQHPTTSPRD